MSRSAGNEVDSGEVTLLERSLEHALRTAFGDNAEVSAAIRFDQSGFWNFRVDVRSVAFQGVSPVQRTIVIAPVVRQLVEAFIDRHGISDVVYDYFGVAPDEPAVPEFPPC